MDDQNTTTEKPVQVKIYLPPPLLERFDNIHRDPVTGKCRYGMRTKTIQKLLETYVTDFETKAQATAADLFKE